MFQVNSRVLLLSICVLLCEGQRDATLPLSLDSLKIFLRAKAAAPEGRSPNLEDIMIRHYTVATPAGTSYKLRNIRRLLDDSRFDHTKPTVLYVHGYVELATDASVRSVVEAYLRHGGFNMLLLDWANLSFGNYVLVALDVPFVGKKAGRALHSLLHSGLKLETLHLVGHSLGSHICSYAAKFLASTGFTVPRLTALDPAYPGFYPPLLGVGLSPTDAAFVDVIHTDGGGYGTPLPVGTVDFWPNEGRGTQPGCLHVTIPFTVEDFCSHWRSWAFWAESVSGGDFLGRSCVDYDSFLRRHCEDRSLAPMGLHASSELKGNYYLRTAAKPPYALGRCGAE